MSYEILALGSNGSGQLGIGDCIDVSIPTPVKDVETITSRPQVIVAGGNHSLLLLSDGSVFSCGQNSDGRCGLPAQQDLICTFQQVPQHFVGDSPVKLCAATWEASIFVNVDDQIYTCGQGAKGELGQGDKVTKLDSPTLLTSFPPQGVKIVDVAACVNHVLIVLSTGEVYGWGSGRKGQLGQPEGIFWSPRLVPGIGFPAIRATCGREFSHVLGAPGEGQHAVLGSDKWGIKSAAPFSVKNWKAVASSWSTLFVLGSDNRLKSWGRDDHGQLASPELPLVQSVAAGSEHVIARSGSGEILAWGWGEHGNCGKNILQNGDVDGAYNVILQESSAVPLGSGCATTWVLSTRG